MPLCQWFEKTIAVKIDGQEISFEIAKNASDANAKHGLYRALAHNMVVGVSEGFKKSLLISGVGCEDTWFLYPYLPNI